MKRMVIKAADEMEDTRFADAIEGLEANIDYMYECFEMLNQDGALDVALNGIDEVSSKVESVVSTLCEAISDTKSDSGSEGAE